MPEFLFAPTPNKAAADFIKSKPAVSRQVFDQLLPELKALAFTIAGVTSADVLQRTRDLLAELPQGGDWNELKKQILGDISPYFVDPSASAEDQAKQQLAAQRRAELLLRTHGQQAYATAQYAMLDEQRELFPHWQYLTLGDSHVRETHAALDGVILPADHEFWQTHFPPWEWSCRCQIVPLTDFDVADIAEREKDKPKDLRNVLDDYAQKDLTATRRLVRNGVTFNLTAPSEQGKPGAYRFHPGDIKPSIETLQKRYDAQTWADFTAWAKKQRIDDLNKTVWQWLGGSTEWPELDELKVVKRLGGSTGAELVKDLEGRFFVRKKGNSPAHLREEVTADLAYQALGLEVPRVKLYPGETKLTPFIEGQTLAEALAKATPQQAQDLLARVQRGFVADALLANYDVAGMNLDNILVDKGGQIWRIDNGGSLRFRAQGAPKTFGPDVTELRTMRDAKINPAAARVFAGITDAEIQKQIRQVLEKRDALLAALPEDLRDVMGQRLDSLAKYGQEAKASPANPFTIEFAEAARKARIVGKQIDLDGPDIEDNAVLVWAEVDAAGAPLTRVKMKLTEGGMKKLLERVKGSLPAGGPTADVAGFDEASIYKTVLDAAKTVNHHQGDGAYNLAKLKALDKTKADLHAAVQKKMIAPADADHYLTLITEIEFAQATKGAAPMVAQKGIKLLPQKTAKKQAADAPEFTIQRVPITYRGKTITNGFAVNQPTPIFSKGTMYETEINGVKIRFKPYEEPPGSDLYALQGLVEIEVGAPLNKAALDQIHGAIGKVGIDNKATTPEYRESLYLWRGINLRRDLADAPKRAAAAAILADEKLTDAERLEKLKSFVADELKLKLPKAGSADYDPAGQGNAFGEGYRRYWRWDLPREKVEKEMDGYVLTHHSSMPTPSLVDQWLTQGGDCTPTAERLRKGISISSGMSPDADLNYGTSSYFFTRIKTRDTATGSGQFHFKIGNLARQDILSMGGDWLAGESQVWKPGVREKSAVKAPTWKSHAKKGSNETLFKWGFNLLDEIDTIVAKSASERQQILDVFAKHGWTDAKPLPDGRKISDVVKLK